MGDKQKIAIVDWTDGTDTTRPGGTGDYSNNGWGKAVDNMWSNKVVHKGTSAEVHRRFFISPAYSCDGPGEGEYMCGQVPQNSMTWAFPWYGPYLNGIYVCDFVAVPSGQGGFGVYARRQLAIDAFWQ